MLGHIGDRLRAIAQLFAPHARQDGARPQRRPAAAAPGRPGTDAVRPGADGKPLPAEEEIRQRCRGARILVVDDDALFREVAQILLEDVGLMVETAADGAEALRLAQGKDYALVLMDVQMPDMDGLETTRRLRQIPRCNHLPILAMTANTRLMDKQRCLDAGMDDFLVKPFQPPILFETLRMWCKDYIPEE